MQASPRSPTICSTAPLRSAEGRPWLCIRVRLAAHAAAQRLPPDLLCQKVSGRVHRECCLPVELLLLLLLLPSSLPPLLPQPLLGKTISMRECGYHGSTFPAHLTTQPAAPLTLQARYKVTVPCGNDMRLYSSPLIKFSKACYQLVSGNAWYLSGEPCPHASALPRLPLLPCCCRRRCCCRCCCCGHIAAAAGTLLLLHCPTRSLPCSARGLPLLWHAPPRQRQDCRVPRLGPLPRAQPVSGMAAGVGC